MLFRVLLCLVSHWRRNLGQFAMLGLGLALATALWSGVQAINSEARNAYDRAAQTLGQDRLERLMRADGAPVPVAEFISLRRAGYRVSPVISGELREGGARLRLLGIDPLTAPSEAQGPALDGDLELNRFFTAPGLLLMSQATSEGPLPPGLPEISVSETVPPGAAITDVSSAARLLGQSDPSYLLIHPRQPFGLEPIAEVTDLEVRAPESGNDIARLTDSFHLNLTAFGFLSFGVGLFIVHGAIGLAFEQRRAMVRTLRAIGTPLRTILLAIGLELALIALVAGAIGLLLGYMIAARLMPGVAGTLSGLYGAQIDGVLSFDPAWALWAIAFTLVGTGAAAFDAMRRIAAMPILLPAMPRAWLQSTSRSLRLQGAAALGLLVVSAALAWLGSGLALAFACLAALLLGAALALPFVINRGLSLVKPGDAFAEWFVADTRQQLPGLSLALMALLLAISANIGVSTMVGSFRVTFTGWLDQRLAAELYVTARSEAEAAELMRQIAPDVDAILPLTSTQTRFFDRPGDLYGIVDDNTYREAWPLLSDAGNTWDVIAAGDGVLINEQMARGEGLGIGDRLAGVGNLQIVGIYSDYGNPAYQAIVSIGRLEALYPNVETTRFALRVDPADAPALASRLRDEFGLPADNVVNQAQVKAFSLEVFEQTFRVTGALNILTLGVAGIALFTSFMTLANIRLPQLAPVWALGMSRRVLALVEVGRCLALALVTFICALPVGLLLAWVLLALVNVEAFGWRLPMQLFVADWGRLLLLTLVAALLASCIPSWRLYRLSPSRLVQIFTQER